MFTTKIANIRNTMSCQAKISSFFTPKGKNKLSVVSILCAKIFCTENFNFLFDRNELSEVATQWCQNSDIFCHKGNYIWFNIFLNKQCLHSNCTSYDELFCPEFIIQ